MEKHDPYTSSVTLSVLMVKDNFDTCESYPNQPDSVKQSRETHKKLSKLNPKISVKILLHYLPDLVQDISMILWNSVKMFPTEQKLTKYPARKVKKKRGEERERKGKVEGAWKLLDSLFSAHARTSEAV